MGCVGRWVPPTNCFERPTQLLWSLWPIGHTSSECIGELYLQLFPLSGDKHNTIILYWSSWSCGPTAVGYV